MTEAPVTEAPITEAPKTEAPITEAPKTEAPVTEAPVTEAPVTEAPITEAPKTEAPVIEAPETENPVSARLLSRGSRGADVRRLQEALAGLGYLDIALINGEFGYETEAALMLFQRDQGLDRDGIAGEKTFAVLYQGSPAPFTGEPVGAGKAQHALQDVV